MDELIPPDVSPEAILGFSVLPMAAVIAGTVQAFTRAGIPVRLGPLMALVLGVGLSVLVAAEVGGILVVALVRGLATGGLAYGGWAVASSKINTNGD